MTCQPVLTRGARLTPRNGLQHRVCSEVAAYQPAPLQVSGKSDAVSVEPYSLDIDELLDRRSFARADRVQPLNASMDSKLALIQAPAAE
jgi:hypothetical protein